MPIAAIAITIKNLDSVLSGVNTPAGTPTVVHTVVMMDASTKYRINIGNARLSEKASPPFALLGLGLVGAPQRQYERDRDDRQRARQLDDSSDFQRIAAVDAVPRGSGCRYGRSIVDRRARKQAEAMVSHAEHAAERRKGQRRDDVEQKITEIACAISLIVRADDRSGCRNRRAAADGRADTDQRRDVGRYLHCLAQHERYDQRGADGRNDDRQRLCADLCNLGQVKTEAEQDNCVPQHLFDVKPMPGCTFGLVLPEQRKHHADQDGGYRSADNRNRLS